MATSQSNEPADVNTCSLRERKKQETRQAIFQTAYTMVDELGPENATVQQICAAAGVSERTFFNYFPTKIAAAFGLENAADDETVANEFIAGTGDLLEDACKFVAQVIPLPADKRKSKALAEKYPEILQEWWTHARQMRERVFDAVYARTSDRAKSYMVVSIVMAAFYYVSHTSAERSRDQIVVLLRAALTEFHEASNTVADN